MAVQQEQEQKTTVRIVIDTDRTEAHVQWDRSQDSADQVLQQVPIQAEKLRLKLPEDLSDLQEKVQAVYEGQHETCDCDVLLLAGVPVTPPVDEAVEWTRNFFNHDFKVDPKTGRIDYRERAANQNVQADELIGKIIPGKSGKPGKDVFGEACTPRLPKKIDLRFGKNIKVDADAGCIYATESGRVRLICRKLSVDKVYEVNQDVGLETGNIDFPGHVSILRDVEDVAKVRADGDIEISGVVGAAEIQSDGDITVGRGIAGKTKAIIKASGTVRAGYISNCHVTADNGVVAYKEIVQSDVKCRGPVTVENGRIAGGSTIALGEVVVAEAGSDGATSTLIAAGEDYSLKDYLDARQSEIHKLKEKIEDVRTKTAPLAANIKRLKPQQKEAFTELMFRVDEAENKLTNVERQMRERIAHVKENGVRRIRVLEMIHPGVTLRIAGITLNIEEAMKGPIIFRPDIGRGCLDMASE